MRLLALSIFLLSCSAIADCEPNLTGKWILDYEHYLDDASKGDKVARQQLDEIWNGEPFIKISFGEINGNYSQRTKQGWTAWDFEYQVTVDERGSCVLTLGANHEASGSMFESMNLWSTSSGFCIRSLGGVGVDDCYIIDEQ